jgi:type VI protein secretion system component VasF
MAEVTSVAETRPSSHRFRRARNRVPVWHLIWLVLAALVFIVPIYSVVQFSLTGVQAGQSPFHW